MAVIAEHLSVAELEERYRSCKDVTSSRRFFSRIPEREPQPLNARVAARAAP